MFLVLKIDKNFANILGQNFVYQLLAAVNFVGIRQPQYFSDHRVYIYVVKRIDFDALLKSGSPGVKYGVHFFYFGSVVAVLAR